MRRNGPWPRPSIPDEIVTDVSGYRLKVRTPGLCQLPADLPDFFGREHELERLERTGEGVASITGAPGVGKTAQPVRLAHRLREKYFDGRLHVNLRAFASGPPVTVEQALSGFLRAPRASTPNAAKSWKGSPRPGGASRSPRSPNTPRRGSTGLVAMAVLEPDWAAEHAGAAAELGRKIGYGPGVTAASILSARATGQSGLIDEVLADIEATDNFMDHSRALLARARITWSVAVAREALAAEHREQAKVVSDAQELLATLAR